MKKTFTQDLMDRAHADLEMRKATALRLADIAIDGWFTVQHTNGMRILACAGCGALVPLELKEQHEVFCVGDAEKQYDCPLHGLQRGGECGKC